MAQSAVRLNDNLEEDLLEAALWYASRKKWRVFPVWERNGDRCGCGDDRCRSPGKHPIAELVPHGFKDATTDEATVKRWWRRHPRAGIAVATGTASGLLVIDIDKRDDRDGLRALNLLEADLGELPPTKTSRTPSGGFHLFFKHVDGIKSSTGKLGTGIDVKADGGYVIVPPSHDLYLWETDDRGKTPKAAQLPDNWIEKLQSLSSSAEQVPNSSQEAEPELVAAAVAVIPNPDLSWNDWKRIGMAIWVATNGSDQGRELFDKWSRKSRKYDSNVTRKEWRAITNSPPNDIGAGTLFYLAKQADPNWREDVQRNDPVRQRIAKLARLDDLDLARVRRDEAKALGIRTDDLDKAVEQARKRQVQRAEPVVPDIDTLATASRPLIDCEDVLTAFVDEFRKVIAGESALAKVLYLSATSRLFDDAMHAVIKGPSSGGKSQVRGRVLEFIPPEDVISFTALSEKALLYMPEDLAHKILSMGEAQDNEQVKFQDYLMRELMSEGKLRYSVVQKRDGELVTIMVEKQGPVAFMVTTTKNKLNAENETRMLSLEVDDSAAQTKAVLRKVAEIEGRNMRGQTIDYDLWRNFQRWLAAGERRVFIPFARTLAELLEPKSVRLRRDISQLFRAIKAHALLHRRHRKYTEDGEIKATIKQDYAGVYPLMRDLLAEASEIKVRKTIAETVTALDAIAATGRRRDDLGIPVRIIAKKLRTRYLVDLSTLAGSGGCRCRDQPGRAPAAPGSLPTNGR